MSFLPNGVPPIWGSVVGTLPNQTDLQAALDTKITSNKLRFFIKDFGAVSDGTTEDTTAVKLASAAASAAGGGVVVFPVGTTVCNNPSVWYPHITYEGLGWNSIIKVTSVVNGGPKVNAKGVVFRNLSFTRTSVSSQFLRIQAEECLVDRCKFFDTATPTVAGFVIDANGTNCLVTNCVFDSVVNSSIIINGSKNAQIKNNFIVNQTIQSGYWTCIQITSLAINTVIEGNHMTVDPTFTDMVNGIGYSTGNVIISNNYIACSRFAIEGSGPAIITGNFCTVSSSPLTVGNYSGCISLPSAKYTTVSGNTVDQHLTTQSSYVGIELPSAEYCTVTGNTLYGSTYNGHAIILDGTSNCTVSGNTVNGYVNGITVYGHNLDASNNIIDANNVTFNGSATNSCGISVIINASTSANDNMVTNNRITGNGIGRGISLSTQSNPGTVDGTVVSKNSVSSCSTIFSRANDTNSVVDASTSVVFKTAAYTATVSDWTIVASSGTWTLTLPSAATAGTSRTYIAGNVGTGVTTVTATAGTINGASSLQLNQYTWVTFLSDGTNWQPISRTN